MRYLGRCIFRAGGAAPPAESTVLQTAGLAAAVSPWDGEEAGRAGVAALYEHARIIQAFHAAHTVIPLRFGCVFPDAASLIERLAQCRAEYQRVLSQLDGHAEMGLRILRAAEPDVAEPTSPGRRYLEHIRRQGGGLGAAEDRWTDTLCEPLRGCYTRRKKEAGPAPGGRLVSVYFLVPLGQVEEFRARMNQVPVPAEVQLLSSGPWPPYNFAGGADE